MSNSDANIDAMKFEQALAELETSIGQMESGKLPLDELVDMYARAQQLAGRCQMLMAQAEQRVTQVYKGADGTPQERPLQA